MTRQIKNKRMVFALQRLREIGFELDGVCYGTDFVDESILDRYVDMLRDEIRKEKESH